MNTMTEKDRAIIGRKIHRIEDLYGELIHVENALENEFPKTQNIIDTMAELRQARLSMGKELRALQNLLSEGGA